MVITSANSQDDLVDPQTGDAVRVDRRLLDRQMWLKRPKVIQRLLTKTAAHDSGGGLALLAKSYLDTERKSFHTSTFTPENVDYFLVLGNVLNADATPKPELITRLECALFMSKANPAARLIVSGGAQVLGVKESELMKGWLIDRGVAAALILVEGNSKDTVENIIMSTALLTQRDAKRVCLITGINAAWREACLLTTYLEHTDSKINVSHLALEVAGASGSSPGALAAEQFLLFKDLGRILDIWKYRDWIQQPV